jgi:putative flippase GtrA
MSERWEGMTPDGQHPLRHGLAFLFGGAIAFAVDAVVLKLLTSGFGMHPIVARLFAISLAMVAGWLAHRRFTFRMAVPPSLREFLRYAAVGWLVSAINYGFFVAIVLLKPNIEPLYALIGSSLAAMVFAYLGMRFAAFRQLGQRRPD